MEAVKTVNNTTSGVQALRDAILSGVWSPGQRLQPAALADRLGVSTTVVREALTRLAGDQLVTPIPNRGFFVRGLDLTEFADITELRCVVEALGSRLAVERGELRWESDLIAAHHAMTRTPRRVSDDPAHINAEWQAAHRRFHMQVLAASDCRPILISAGQLADQTELYLRWAAPSTAASTRDVEAEHRRILDAALARDAEELAHALRDHYEATLAVVREAGLVAPKASAT
ncbi:GntR family transcriptional regulator [Streptomyces abyssomicinicus]|uniref:GntR family transcriptional regulator n=1 Tax=Streptomyces abyssomicinicus TaxID=574929 RepID=UPI0013DEAEDC|nr:GntR family transcriptional regulator [Streptomyces abyssomicinicus]